LKKISGYSLVLPLFAADLESPGVYQTRSLVGSSFLLGDGFVLTAGHVAHALFANGGIGVLGLPNLESPEELHVSEVADAEVLPHDLAILRIQLKPNIKDTRAVRFEWLASELSVFDEVWSIGYPYGTHVVEEKHRIIQRAFTGTIVASPGPYQPVGSNIQPFNAYELSFAAPRGLSGAPLMDGREPSQSRGVVGVVIGNSSSSMLVHQSEETISDGTSVQKVIQYESLTLGVAVACTSILPLRSRLLGSTVEEYLRGQGLVIDSQG